MAVGSAVRTAYRNRGDQRQDLDRVGSRKACGLNTGTLPIVALFDSEVQ